MHIAPEADLDMFNVLRRTRILTKKWTPTGQQLNILAFGGLFVACCNI